MSDGDLKSKSWLYKLEDSYDFVLETLKNRFTESFMLLLEDYKKNNEQYQTVFLDQIGRAHV